MTDYTKQSLKNIKQNAKNIGIEVKPSSNKDKKFDVYKDNKKVASIGASNYKDYHLYKQEDKELAEKRRNLYKARHKNNIDNVGSPGYYSWKILWN